MTKQLITISDNAAKRIKEILSNAESGVKGVRVSVKSGGCAGMEYVMTYLKETIPTDEVVKDNNVEVFIFNHFIIWNSFFKISHLIFHPSTSSRFYRNANAFNTALSVT